jgi:hypothetical protein
MDTPHIIVAQHVEPLEGTARISQLAVGPFDGFQEAADWGSLNEDVVLRSIRVGSSADSGWTVGIQELTAPEDVVGASLPARSGDERPADEARERDRGERL